MEELCKIAMAHYQASSDEVRYLAHKFFNTMDRNGDGQVDLREFLTFMGEEGYAQMTSSYFFEKLDLDHNGTLDFFEVMAVYYIVKSGRPFCDHCKNFIPGTYFTCVGCLEGPIGGSFHLCLDCYLSPISHHDHEGVSKFLDNYSLLEAKIRSSTTNQDHQSKSLQVKSRPSAAMHQPSSSAMVTYSPAPNNHVHNNWDHNYYPYPLSSSAMVTHSPAMHHHPVAMSNSSISDRQNWKIALGALDTAIKIGVIGTTIATCSIL